MRIALCILITEPGGVGGGVEAEAGTDRRFGKISNY